MGPSQQPPKKPSSGNQVSKAQGATPSSSHSSPAASSPPKSRPAQPFREVIVKRSPPSSPDTKRRTSNAKDPSPTQPRMIVEELPTASPPASPTKTPAPTPAPTPAQSSANATPSKDSDTSPPKSTYDPKTQRILAWSKLVRSLQPFIWAMVILVVVVPLMGKFLLSYSAPSQAGSGVGGRSPLTAPLTEVRIPAMPKRAGLDQAVVAAIESAHTTAQDFATAELDEWTQALEPRVDHFLDWYFNYFNQKKIEFMTPMIWASSATVHAINPKQKSGGEAVMTRFTEGFQREFAKQVLVPQNAQIRLEVITTATVDQYLTALSHNLGQVQSTYRVPQGQWERYLSDISTTIQDTEGNLSNLSLKMLVGGSGYLLTKPLVLATAGKIGSKISAKVASKATAKLAAKTGSTVAAELGTSLVDPIVGVGIFIWDLWDYRHTVNVERPILRANLLEYIHAVESSLLMDPETGVMSAIAQLEQGIFKTL